MSAVTPMSAQKMSIFAVTLIRDLRDFIPPLYVILSNKPGHLKITRKGRNLLLEAKAPYIKYRP
jgi:hypothetical protein